MQIRRALRTTRGPQSKLRFALALLVLLAGGLLFVSTAATQRSAVVLNWDGAIGPATSDFVIRGLRDAATSGAPLVVLRLDTPGGLDASMREIIRAIVGSAIPVVGFVSPGGARAASAGTYILYASHVAAMSPGTNLGAATPVAIGGGLPLPSRDPDAQRPSEPEEDARDGDSRAGQDADADTAEPAATADAAPARKPASTLETKAVNDAVAYIRALAEMRGRNADWAEQAVRDAASLSAKAALEQGVIDIVASDLDDLMRQIDGRTVHSASGAIVLDTEGLELRQVLPDWRTRLLGTITNPNVALILMLIGFYGLIFEFMNPGALYPGTIGGICLLLGLYALAALPVNYAGLGLMMLGLALMVGEAFAPSFGILGIGGTVAFVLGATILIDTDAPGFELSWPVIAGVATFSLILTLVILRLAIESSRRQVQTGLSAMIGSAGTVLDWAGTHGHVLAHGERWQACAATPLAAGSMVRIVRIEGLTLEVVAEPQPLSQHED